MPAQPARNRPLGLKTSPGYSAAVLVVDSSIKITLRLVVHQWFANESVQYSRLLKGFFPLIGKSASDRLISKVHYLEQVGMRQFRCLRVAFSRLRHLDLPQEEPPKDRDASQRTVTSRSPRWRYTRRLPVLRPIGITFFSPRSISRIRLVHCFNASRRSAKYSCRS